MKHRCNSPAATCSERISDRAPSSGLATRAGALPRTMSTRTPAHVLDKSIAGVPPFWEKDTRPDPKPEDGVPIARGSTGGVEGNAGSRVAGILEHDQARRRSAQPDAPSA
jgi:hypothetical protein